MAKRRKSYSARKCEPLDKMLDIAGAVAYGAYARHVIKKEYQQGRGDESVKSATAFLAMAALRGGSGGTIAKGGLIGINSAVRDIERSRAAARRRVSAYSDGIDATQYKTNDNRYAWRLNCEDGSSYGISPQDYETRDAYNRALSRARGDQPNVEEREVPQTTPVQENPFEGSPLICCRVSRLDNGANDYYVTDDETIKVGDTITVQTENGSSEGIVIGVKRLSDMTEDELSKGTVWVLTPDDDE